jgi:hypothetical protein
MSFTRKTYKPAKTVLEPIPLHLRRNAVFARMDVPAAPQPKDVKAKPGKGAPNREEREWMDSLVAHGCICCILDGQQPRETAVHHILRGGRRMGHLYTIPLCDPGHHQGGQSLGMVSRHPWKARFEAKYGTELELLYLVQKRISKGAFHA